MTDTKVHQLAGLVAGGLLVMVVGAPRADAQTYLGGIRGSVHDPGGVVPKAEVTLINEATNAKRTTTSNDVGEYVFTNVPPGTYSLRVAISGFRHTRTKRYASARRNF